MKKNKIKIFIALIFLLLSTIACEASVSTAKISDAYLTANDDGSGEKTVF